MLRSRNGGGISTPHITSNSNSPHLTSQHWASNQMRKVIGKYLSPLVCKMPEISKPSCEQVVLIKSNVFLACYTIVFENLPHTILFPCQPRLLFPQTTVALNETATSHLLICRFLN